jgi:hypothetical protein
LDGIHYVYFYSILRNSLKDYYFFKEVFVWRV